MKYICKIKILNFSYRFQDLLPDADLVRDMQRELDEIIQIGVANITKLLRSSESGSASAASAMDDDSFALKRGSESYIKGWKLISNLFTCKGFLLVLQRLITDLPSSSSSSNLLSHTSG